MPARRDISDYRGVILEIGDVVIPSPQNPITRVWERPIAIVCGYSLKWGDGIRIRRPGLADTSGWAASFWIRADQDTIEHCIAKGMITREHWFPA